MCKNVFAMVTLVVSVVAGAAYAVCDDTDLPYIVHNANITVSADRVAAFPKGGMAT